MGIRKRRFPELGVTMNVYSGVVSVEDVKAHIMDMQAADPAWRINYVDPSMESRVDLAAVPELKYLAAAKLKVVHGNEPAICAFVSEPGAHDLVLSFWPSYLGMHGDYPATTAAFTSLEAACAWLGLPQGACGTLAEAVDT